MAGGTNVPSKIPVTSLDSAEHKIPGRKTKRRGRTKRSRRSFDEVCLDNADTFIDGGTRASELLSANYAFRCMACGEVCYYDSLPEFNFDASSRSKFKIQVLGGN